MIQHINPAYFWDVNTDLLDENKSKKLIIERVFSLGSLHEIDLGFYRKKYTLQNDAIVLKSLLWFEDVELACWPVIIKDPKLSWLKVKKRLIQSVREV
jgi:hypothetical protein